MSFVGYSDYPAGKVKNSTPDQVLARCRDGMVGDRGGTMTSDKAIELSGAPGRTFAWTGGDGFDGQARIFLKANRMYQVMVERKAGIPVSKDFGKFFHSFRIQ